MTYRARNKTKPVSVHPIVDADRFQDNDGNGRLRSCDGHFTLWLCEGDLSATACGFTHSDGTGNRKLAGEARFVRPALARNDPSHLYRHFHHRLLPDGGTVLGRSEFPARCETSSLGVQCRSS